MLRPSPPTSRQWCIIGETQVFLVLGFAGEQFTPFKTGIRSCRMKSDLVFSSDPDVHGVCQAEVKQVGFHL